MQDSSNHVPGACARTERLLTLLIVGHPDPCSRTELAAELPDIDHRVVGDALIHLEAEGVVIMTGERVRASRCARYLATLDLIAV